MEKTKEKALSGIPFSELKMMVDTYRSYASSQAGFDENTFVKCVWFKIEDIKEMYAKLEEEKADGLRLYFGRYPADVSDFDNPKPIPDTNSVVFVSTRPDDKGVAGSDYFTDISPMIPVNRGEQCQPHCGGTSPLL